MRKTIMATTLALAVALTTVSGFAAPPKSPAVTPNLSPTAQPVQVADALAKEIFVSTSKLPVLKEFYWGSCSYTCESCYSAWGCPRDPFGNFQSCLSECP